MLASWQPLCCTALFLSVCVMRCVQGPQALVVVPTTELGVQVGARGGEVGTGRVGLSVPCGCLGTATSKAGSPYH